MSKPVLFDANDRARSLWLIMMDGQVTQELAMRERVSVSDIQRRMLLAALQSAFDAGRKATP